MLLYLASISTSEGIFFKSWYLHCRFRKTVRDLEKYQFTRDLHLSDVLVFPSGTDFHDNQLFLSGEIILQDKVHFVYFV